MTASVAAQPRSLVTGATGLIRRRLGSRPTPAFGPGTVACLTRAATASSEAQTPETILRERADQDGYSWTILRLPTVYGPGQKTEGLFDQMVRMARNGSLAGRIDWPGRTSVIYVDDVADVMIDFGLRAEAAGQIYCLASDESSLTVGELAREVGRAVGRPIRPIAIPAPLMKVMRLLAWNP